ncbi:hypothetical protein [Perlucidibaca aquatica]|nr:hypothetical protein [Perlucidibaca aquatica]
MTALEAAQQIADMKKQIALLDTKKSELMERLAYMQLLSVIFFDEADVQ